MITLAVASARRADEFLLQRGIVGSNLSTKGVGARLGLETNQTLQQSTHRIGQSL
jgi:hypothetical protein